MLRTGQLPAPLRGGLPPPQRRDLAQRRECCYRGPWRLPGPDSHRLAAVSLALGYTLVPPFVTPAPELLDAHAAGIYREPRARCRRSTAAASCHYRPGFSQIIQHPLPGAARGRPHGQGTGAVSQRLLA
jgi:hypothetical protein